MADVDVATLKRLRTVVGSALERVPEQSAQGVATHLCLSGATSSGAPRAALCSLRIGVFLCKFKLSMSNSSS